MRLPAEHASRTCRESDFPRSCRTARRAADETYRQPGRRRDVLGHLGGGKRMIKRDGDAILTEKALRELAPGCHDDGAKSRIGPFGFHLEQPVSTSRHMAPPELRRHLPGDILRAGCSLVRLRHQLGARDQRGEKADRACKANPADARLKPAAAAPARHLGARAHQTLRHRSHHLHVSTSAAAAAPKRVHSNRAVRSIEKSRFVRERTVVARSVAVHPRRTRDL